MRHTEADDERAELRRKLIAAREALAGRSDMGAAVQDGRRGWHVGRHETSSSGYWPVKCEFDPLPALYRWTEGAPDGVTRRIGLPRVDRESGSLRWHLWFPGCPMEPDAYDIPKPKGTEALAPELLVVPCLGYGPGGVRLGYGGGFFERTMRTLRPQPMTVGVSFAQGFLPLLRPGLLDFELDAVLTEDGVMWQRG